MTTFETIIATLENLDAFYCTPADNVLYIAVNEESENLEELEALFELVGTQLEDGTTIEWEWESLE